MKQKGKDILFADLVHFIPVLITHAVVNVAEMHTRQQGRDGVLGARFSPVSGHKGSAIRDLFDKSVRSLTICLNGGHSDLTVGIAQGVRLRHDLGSVAHCSLEHRVHRVHLESDVLDTIAMLFKMMVDLLKYFSVLGTHTLNLVEGSEGRGKDEGDVAVADDMGTDSSVARLEATVGDLLEAHASDVVCRGLLCVADVPVHMVITFVAGQVVGHPVRGRGATRHSRRSHVYDMLRIK